MSTMTDLRFEQAKKLFPTVARISHSDGFREVRYHTGGPYRSQAVRHPPEPERGPDCDVWICTDQDYWLGFTFTVPSRLRLLWALLRGRLSLRFHIKVEVPRD